MNSGTSGATDSGSTGARAARSDRG
jgi:hypothetical protein